MKKILLVALCAVLLTGTFFFLKTYYFIDDADNLAEDKYERKNDLITINGNGLTMPSEIIGIGTIGLPVQEIAETLGYEVTWRNDESKMYLAKDETTIILEIDSNVIIRNGIEEEVYSAPLIINDDVYAAAPVLANLLGFEYLIESDDVVNITDSDGNE